MHTRSPVNYYLVAWTIEQKDWEGQWATGLYGSGCLFCFPFFWLLMNNAAFWGWWEGQPHGFGIETRNKCLYVVSYELEAFESLYEVTAKCLWCHKV